MSAAISFPGWTPPPLSSLDFGSNCTHVRAFLQSWFDLTPYQDIDRMPGHNYNVTFWVPETVDARATETYFRDALPFDLQNVASYGEILQWERFLRDNYTEAVGVFLDLAAELNDTETDSLPLDLSYYDHIILTPSRQCRPQVCNLGFDWDKLGDVNGPGVFIYYILLLAIGVIYSLIALFGALKYRLGRRSTPRYRPPSQQLPQSRSMLADFFTTVILSFSGFSDGAAVFSLALPCAIFYNYVAGDGAGVRVSSRKDLVLELWVLVYALCVCIWFYRVGACIRRVERAKRMAMYGEPLKRSAKRVLATGFVLSLSVVAFIALVIFLAMYHNAGGGVLTPFDFEEFWDGLCDYGTLSAWDVVIALACLVGYCLGRVLLLGSIVSCIVREEMKRASGGHGGNGPLSDKEKGQRFRRTQETYKKVYSEDSRYRQWTDILGMLDMVAFMAAAAAILWYYHKNREQLSHSTGIELFKDGWSLGQILAVSSLLPVVVGFVHTYVGVRDEPVHLPGGHQVV